MKMSKELFDKLKAKIDEIPADVMKQNAGGYELGLFPRSELTKDLQRRFCWDVMWATGWYGENSVAIQKENLVDEHIYTALKKCLPKLTRKF
jgi:hypothetical protein